MIESNFNTLITVIMFIDFFLIFYI